MDINLILMAFIVAFLISCFFVLLEIQHECKLIECNLDCIRSSINKIRIGGK